MVTELFCNSKHDNLNRKIRGQMFVLIVMSLTFVSVDGLAYNVLVRDRNSFLAFK